MDVVGVDQQRVIAERRPRSVYSRVFGLSCKANAGVGVESHTHSPIVGDLFWLEFLGIHFCGGDDGLVAAGNIYITFGQGVPSGEDIATRWERVVPFWAGLTKPAIMVQGISDYIWFPMRRLFEGNQLRFGMAIENGSGVMPFWVNAWFEISEG